MSNQNELFSNHSAVLKERVKALRNAQRLLLEMHTQLHAQQIQLQKDQQHLVKRWNQLTLVRHSLRVHVTTASNSETLLEEK